MSYLQFLRQVKEGTGVCVIQMHSVLNMLQSEILQVAGVQCVSVCMCEREIQLMPNSLQIVSG